jgi:hypothetical protein
MFVSIQPGPSESAPDAAGASMRAAFWSASTPRPSTAVAERPASGTFAAMEAIVMIDPCVPAASMRWPRPDRHDRADQADVDHPADLVDVGLDEVPPGRSTYSRPRR